MKRAFVIALLIALLAGVPVVSAQGGEEEGCKTEDLAAWYTGVQPWFNVLSAVLDPEDSLELGEDAADYAMRRALFEIDRLERPACADPVVADLYRKMNAYIVMLYCLFRDQECSEAASAMMSAEASVDLPDLEDLIEKDDAILPVGWDWEAVKAMFPDEEAAEEVTEAAPQEVGGDYGTRTNPVPLGEAFQVDDGSVRLMEVFDPYEATGDVYGLDEGLRLVGFRFEYDCQLADPNETCDGSDIWIDAIITQESKILSSDTIVMVTDDVPRLSNAEGFGGTLLEGYSFEAVPADAVIASVRVDGWGVDETYLSVK